MLLKHRFAETTTALLCTLSTLTMSAGAHAGAPQVKTQAPGFYRMMLGDFEITALSDGTVDLPLARLLTQTTPAEVEKALSRAFLTPVVETSVNAYLINTGSKLVLVDAGDPPGLRPTLGKLMTHLKAAGYQPEQVDAVLLTHMHRDHVGGLVANGKPAFANATVHVERREAHYWLSKTHMEKAPEAVKSFFEVAMASIEPYQRAGRFKPFDGDAELVPGIRSRVAPGHTPGHSTFVVESQGHKLVLWGDVLHAQAVQVCDPAVAIQVDVDGHAAVAQRKRAYQEAAQQGYWIGASHLAFPGLGHLRAEGKGFVWVPANYAVPR
jgi:glyoxylase-like metal-dependent hydrolase (beta-lactamase superfamily II)